MLTGWDLTKKGESGGHHIEGDVVATRGNDKDFPDGFPLLRE